MRTLFIAIVALTIGLAASPHQQSSSTAASAESGLEVDLRAATSLLAARRLEEALTAFQALLDASRQQNDLHVESRALVGLAGVSFRKALYPQAREYGLRGLELAERTGNMDDVGRANLILSSTAEFLGDRADAKSRAERAIAALEATDDRPNRARATIALLRVDPPSLPDYRRLMDRAIANAHAGGDTDLEASAVHLLGDEYFRNSEYELALAAYERAVALYTETRNMTEVGAVYNSVGRLYRTHGQLQPALEYQLKALALHEKGPDTFYHMQSLSAVSIVYSALDDTDNAQAYLERAVTIAEQFGSPRIQDFLRGSLADILVQQGEYGRAVDLLQGVIARAADTNLSHRYLQLSYALRKQGRADEALRAADAAVARCLDTDAVNCPDAFYRRAQAQLAEGNATAALDDATTALNRIEDTRAKLLPSDFFKREFVRHREPGYSLAIDLRLRQGHKDAALETAELARSRAFIDLLASRDLKVKPSDPLSQLPGILRGGAAPVASELSSLATATPAKATDLVGVAQRLKSTLLTYWVAEDALFMWVVSPDGHISTARVDVLESKLRSLVRATAPFEEARVRGTSKTIAMRGGEAFVPGSARANAWRELYDLLIRPVRGDLPTAEGALLTIVPHDVLSDLPFAALLSERGRYLLEDFTLHYAPAGSVLQFTAGRHRTEARRGAVLIIADPVVTKAARLGRPLPPLPGARVEASAIARQLPPGQLTLLIGRDATEARVASAVEHKAVVHFATHAVVREDAPFESFLALAPSGEAENGLMTADEVYRLNLDAELVVLSACRSGGARVGGDGIAAFARAFIYAGTPSVVASMWDVSDGPTATLIGAFYHAWLAGRSKSRALRAAQLQMLRNLRAGRVTVQTAAGPIVVPEHPIFWAGFSLIGEPE